MEIAYLIKSTSTKETCTTPSTFITNTTSKEMTLEELNWTRDRNMTHLKCLKENNLLTPDRKVKIVNDLEEIMHQISARHGIKRGNEDMDYTHSNNTNSSVS